LAVPFNPLPVWSTVAFIIFQRQLYVYRLYVKTGIGYMTL